MNLRPYSECSDGVLGCAGSEPEGGRCSECGRSGSHLAAGTHVWAGSGMRRRFGRTRGPDGGNALVAEHGANGHVMVVEDDPVQSTLLRAWLAKAGYQVEVVADGPSCLAALAES